MEPIITITTTTDKKEALEEMGRRLLKQRLIACIQVVGPIKSLYWWKGTMEDASEWLGIMKSRKSLYARVEAEIRSLHSYELPEIVAKEASDVLPAYGDWVRAETGAGGESGQEADKNAGQET
jgi:periplasmic divalent cation tolerance protein